MKPRRELKQVIHLSEDEKAILLEKAAGVPLAKYIREAALALAVSEDPPLAKR